MLLTTNHPGKFTVVTEVARRQIPTPIQIGDGLSRYSQPLLNVALAVRLQVVGVGNGQAENQSRPNAATSLTGHEYRC